MYQEIILSNAKLNKQQSSSEQQSLTRICHNVRTIQTDRTITEWVAGIRTNGVTVA